MKISSSRMRSSAAWITAASCLLITSCHRPDALYQRMPVETFRSPQKQTPATPTVADTIAVATLNADHPAANPAPVPFEPAPIYASRDRMPAPETAQPIRQHLRQASTLLGQSTTTEHGAFPQPRPKPKPQQKKSLREMLGMQPRKKLNWWQRIHWSLKASIPIILVAVIFALFHVTILAIIFGLLGAFLLIRGLKKAFRVRRPWF